MPYLDFGSSCGKPPLHSANIRALSRLELEPVNQPGRNHYLLSVGSMEPGGNHFHNSLIANLVVSTSQSTVYLTSIVSHESPRLLRQYGEARRATPFQMPRRLKHAARRRHTNILIYNTLILSILSM